jgi:cytochrome c-type biogenesis protein
VDPATTLWLSFLAGIYAPIGSPCVFVLYPAYLSFLAGTAGNEEPGIVPFSLGLVVVTGVILSLLCGGILFALLLQAWGGVVRAIITPSASLLLLVFSLLLLLDYSPFGSTVAPQLPRSGARSPHAAALLLGLFFGLIILPCNAAVIMVLITLATTSSGAMESVGIFLAFGAGMTFPLLVIAGISRFRSRQVMAFLSGHRLIIRRIAGLAMFVIAAWYLALFFFPGMIR